jgi:hypothetical protein
MHRCRFAQIDLTRLIQPSLHKGTIDQQHFSMDEGWANRINTND